MSNPFKKYVGGTYSNHIYRQIKNMTMSEQKEIDMGGKSVTEFRTALAYVCKKYTLAFSTKTDDSGNVWVNRIS
jgi:hypothetical protein